MFRFEQTVLEVGWVGDHYDQCPLPLSSDACLQSRYGRTRSRSRSSRERCLIESTAEKGDSYSWLSSWVTYKKYGASPLLPLGKALEARTPPTRPVDSEACSRRKSSGGAAFILLLTFWWWGSNPTAARRWARRPRLRSLWIKRLISIVGEYARPKPHRRVLPLEGSRGAVPRRPWWRRG